MKGRLIGTCAAMVALLAAGLATGVRIYYALFFALLLIVVYGAASVAWALWAIDVSIRGMQPSAVRTQRLQTVIHARLSSPLPVGGIRMTLNVPGGNGGVREMDIPAKPFVKGAYRNVICCPHRGEFDIGIAYVEAEDLFGLFCVRRKRPKQLTRIVVAPLARECECMRLHATDMGTEFASRATEDNASPSDIRKWQDGDELKKIHWKLTLRKRELIVRTFENSARPDTLILPDLCEISAPRDLKLTLEDNICEVCLGAARAQLENRYPVRMPLMSARPREVSGMGAQDIAAFTDALTRVRFDCPYSYEQVLLQMTGRLQRTGGVVLATANLTTRVADIALRMLRTGILVRLYYIEEKKRDEALEMLEMLKRSGADVVHVDPWKSEVAHG